MFSTFDCAVKGWRQKEDMWNAIISGFLTGGCLALRSEFFFTTAVLSGSVASKLPLLAVKEDQDHDDLGITMPIAFTGISDFSCQVDLELL